ncbi:MAG: TRAP transporter large permease [Betaproteobacteria bacterium]|nr:TRAP transporter large permease [Betaproteobacteria bacterium]
MTPFEIAALSVFGMLVLLIAGVYVGVVLTVVSYVGVWIIKGDPTVASNLLLLAVADSIASYVFGVIPLFVLMGMFVSISDIGKDTYEVANVIFRRLRGGLGVATVAANALFAAITGVSIASASVFTKISVPQMLRHGYQPRFAVGVVAGSSLLGMLIPPSLLLILFAVLTDQSVGDMFLAGIIPGILLSLMFCLGIVLAAYLIPNSVMRADALATGTEQAHMSLGEALRKLSPILLLIGVVIGGIYGGVFTPTEAGAIGAFGAFLLTAARRKLTWASLWQVLVETGHVTATICFLIIAATMYSRMLGVAAVPGQLAQWVTGLDANFYVVLAIYLGIILMLGCLIDAASIMLITVPLFLPLFMAFKVDLVWLGVITTIAVEVGLLTPPFGVAVYVIKATLDDQRITIPDIFRGALPFAGIVMLTLLLIIIFPGIATGILGRF